MHTEEQQAIGFVLTKIDAPVVVELGAYCGEEGHIFDAMGGQYLTHIMVEPDPLNCERIALTYASRRASFIHLIKGAIASTPGRATFLRSYDSRDGSRGSGSICTPTGHLEHFPSISFVDQIAVDCFTLDDIFRSAGLKRIDLLYVDIQGAESQMIRGGRRALQHTKYLFIEAEEIQMYENQALKHELIAMLPGWELIRDFGFNIFLTNGEYREAGASDPQQP